MKRRLASKLRVESQESNFVLDAVHFKAKNKASSERKRCRVIFSAFST
jgi:hypothetical protein